MKEQETFRILYHWREEPSFSTSIQSFHGQLLKDSSLWVKLFFETYTGLRDISTSILPLEAFLRGLREGTSTFE